MEKQFRHPHTHPIGHSEGCFLGAAIATKATIVFNSLPEYNRAVVVL
jgi:hypothetical protein